MIDITKEFKELLKNDRTNYNKKVSLLLKRATIVVAKIQNTTGIEESTDPNIKKRRKDR